MTRIVTTLPDDSEVVDTIQRISAAQAKAMYAQGVRGVMRYLETLDQEEADGILAAGLALGGVMYADDFSGPLAVSRARDAGLVCGTAIAADLEAYGLSADRCWSSLVSMDTAITKAEYVSALYNGMRQPLSAAQLGALPQHPYWKSGSDVPVPTLHGAPIGYALIQHVGDPKDHTVNWRHVMRGGVNVDVNATQADNLGRRWPFTVECRDAPTEPDLSAA